MSAQLWVVAAGKGGVGKTFTASSIAITLSKLNYKVLVVDFDTSGANLHSSFGLSPAKKNLLHYFQGTEKLSQVIQPTQIPKLSIIQGFWDSWSSPQITPEQAKNLALECKETAFDYVVFDMGPGANPVHLEMFHLADEKILISNAEPTAVEKNYRFIEAFICHSLKEDLNKDQHLELFKCLAEYRESDKQVCFSFRNYLKNSTGHEFNFFEELEKKPVRLIINSCRSRLDQDLGHSIKSVCNKYFDFSVDYVGAIDFDNAVWQSVRGREPVLIEKPFTPLAGQFLSICKQLTNPNFSANYYRAIV